MTEPSPLPDPPPLPARATVVVIGGGVIGCSIAWHLTRRGVADVLLLERRQLGCGTTWHSQGVVGLVRETPAMTRLAMMTNEVLPELEALSGLSTGFRREGTLICAGDAARLAALERLAASRRRLGLEIRPIPLAEAAERWPLLRTDDLAGAFFMAQEGQTNPLDTVQAYARGARMGGARIVENVAVTAVERDNGRVTGVRAERATSAAEASLDGVFVAADVVVNAGGLWGREIGRLAGAGVPVQAVEQTYFVTEPVPGIESRLPILRDFHEDILVREDAGQLTIGATNPRERPWGVDGIPEDFCFDELPEDLDAIEAMLGKIVHRVPALADVGMRRMLTGPEGVSPDARYHLGEMPGLGGFFVACGMSGIGVGSSGGVGRALADWIVDGRAPPGLGELDIARMLPDQSTLAYLLARVPEAGGAVFSVSLADGDAPLADEADDKADDERRSALHEMHVAAGAVFESCADWRRPARYEGMSVADEQRLVRHGMALTDTGFDAKVRIRGAGAVAALRALCETPPDGAPGALASTRLHDVRGLDGIRVDVAIVAADEALVLAAPALRGRSCNGLAQALAPWPDVAVSDVTERLAAVELLGRVPDGGLAGLDLDMTACRSVIPDEAGGWLLRHPTADGLERRELLVPVARAPERIGRIGRLLDASTGEAPRWIGARARRACLLEAGADERGTLRPVLRSVRLTLADGAPALHGDEPLWLDGREVGHLVEVAFGEWSGRWVALAELAPDVALPEPGANGFEVEIGTARHGARSFATGEHVHE